MICPSSRSAAFGQLHAFLPLTGIYTRDRSQVRLGHPSVSRLSPAICHRLITEDEVAAAAIAAHSFGPVEKFVQEVYWRRYWKSWLALRPNVWRDYLAELEVAGENPATRRVEEGQTGNRVIDYFANELVTTGYLHNHARMWFAAWWIHEARLPWQSGAAFFFRHLLDGDPASNTLSWRWVAGLQTQGKTYLARRSNLEKYLDPELLDLFSEDLVKFENPQALPPERFSKPSATNLDQTPGNIDPSLPTGLWVHEEDLSAETSPLGRQLCQTVAVTADVHSWKKFRFPPAKIQWITAALQDAAIRAGEVWNSPIHLDTRLPYIDVLVRWADSAKLQQVVAVRPEVGPLYDSLPSLATALAHQSIRLVLIDRPEDLRIRPFATGGFFPFWERLRKMLTANLPAANATP